MRWIAFACPGCGTKFNPPETAAGKTARCPKCQRPLRIPDIKPAEHVVPTPEVQQAGSQRSRRHLLTFVVTAAVFGIALCLLIVLSTGLHSQRYSTLYHEAVVASLKGDYVTAIAKADAAAAFATSDRELADLDITTGCAFAKRGDHYQAIERLTAGLARADRDKSIDTYLFLAQRAECYEALGKKQLAAADNEAAHKAAVASHAKFMAERRATGSALRAAGKLKEAIAYHSETLDTLRQSTDPLDIADVLEARAACYDDLGRHAEAEQDREAAATAKRSAAK